MPPKNLSILFVTYGTKLAPATRYRVYGFLPFLEKEGLDCKVFSIISGFTTNLMIKSSMFNSLQKIIYYIQVSIERVFRACVVVFLAGKFDVVFLQRVTFPFGLERLMRMKNKNIIFDIDDSIYMLDKEERGLIGCLKKYSKKKEVTSVLRVSKCAIVENAHIENFVRQYCNDIYVITGPIDSIRNFPKEYKADTKNIIIGWIGSPSTVLYLDMLKRVLRRLQEKCDVDIRLIGSGPHSIDGVRFEIIDWSEGTEVFELHKFDIGIMPMPDNEWTRGKVGCKMLQYMANAIPAVVSYTPTNAAIIKNGDNGFLVNSEEEWIEKLSLLVEDPVLRQKIGISGRKTVEEKFSVKVNMPKYIEIFKNVYNKW